MILEKLNVYLRGQTDPDFNLSLSFISCETFGKLLHLSLLIFKMG